MILLTDPDRRTKMHNKDINPISKFFYLAGILMIIGAFVSGIIAVVITADHNRIMSQYGTVQGTIQRVSLKDGVRSIEYDGVWAYYEVNGVEYTDVRIYSYPDPPITGQTVTIYYDLSDPGQTIPFSPDSSPDGNSAFRTVVFIVCAAVMIFAGYSAGHMRSNTEVASRYKSYESYGGDTTERAGTLFDKEVDPKDLRLPDEYYSNTPLNRKKRRHRKFWGVDEYDTY